MYTKHQKVAQLVEKAYLLSRNDFARWMWNNHLQFVASKAEELSNKLNANADLAVADAWLHDFGDGFINRHDKRHEEISELEATKVLNEAGYSKRK